MIEVYKNTSEQVELKLYVNGARADSEIPVTVTITDFETGAVVQATVTASQVVDSSTKNVYFYPLPLSSTTLERTLSVVWAYRLLGQTGTRTDIVEVVTPYVTPDELINLDPKLSTKTFDQLKDIERRCRLIIDSFCSQSFGRKNKTIEVSGTGSRIYLPERIISLTSLTNGLTTYDLTSYNLVITTGRFAIKQLPYSDTIKTGEEPGYDFFKDYNRYIVTGEFGYEYVPNNVNLAAGILAVDLFCSDRAYYQRDLKSVAFATTDMEFNSRFTAGTGNLDVDRLLEPYINLRYLVI